MIKNILCMSFIGFCGNEESGNSKPKDLLLSNFVCTKSAFGTMFANCATIVDADIGKLRVGELIVDGPVASDHIWESAIDDTLTDVVRYNTSNPRVLGNESILLGFQNLDTTGPQTFWYSPKSAFRSGSSTGGQWNINVIGQDSFAVGRNTIASGLQSSCIGSDNEATGNQAFVYGLNNTANGPLAAVGGSGNTILNANHTFAYAQNMTGEAEHCVLFGGLSSIVGTGADVGVVTGSIVGSFAAFDSSSAALHTIWENYQNKQIFQNGFVRGGGSQSYNGPMLPGLTGNDGAREKMIPYRFFVESGSTTTVNIPLQSNQITLISGTVVIVGNVVAKRATFTISGGSFVNDAGTVIMDKVPTVSLEFSNPLLMFDLSNVTFGVTNLPPSVTVDFVGPVGEDMTVNFIVYLYDIVAA